MPSRTATVKGPTLRERRRQELRDSAIEAAHRQLVDDGAVALSVRGVAAEVGVVPSALYRYFPSRADLITQLIVRAFDDLSEQLEQAATRAVSRHREDARAAWLAVANAYRRWALANPADFGLIYGTPIPGYSAPEDPTRSAGERPGRIMVRVLVRAAERGQVDEAVLRRNAGRMTPGLRDQVNRWGTDHAPNLSPELLMVGVGMWHHLQGVLTAEVFGHMPPLAAQAKDVFRFEMEAAADRLGLP